MKIETRKLYSGVT